MTTNFTARWWHEIEDGRLQCDLCPRDCHAVGVQTVAVTAGYIQEAPRREFFAKMDAGCRCGSRGLVPDGGVGCGHGVLSLRS